MKNHHYQNYIAWGITVFAVVSCSILLFFLFFKAAAIQRFLATIVSILEPIIVGAVLAYILTPVYNFFTKNIRAALQKRMKDRKAKKLASALGITITIILLLLVIYGLIAMVVPQIYTSIRGIIVKIPAYIDHGNEWLTAFLADNPNYEVIVVSIYDSLTGSFEDWLFNTLLPSLETLNNMDSITSLLDNLKYIVGGVTTGVRILVRIITDFIIGVIVAVYLLASKATLAAQAKKVIYSVMPLPYANSVIGQFRNVHKVFGGFISGKLLDSLIIGILCFIVTSLVQIPYAMLISVFVGVTNIIPFFGPFIGAIPSAFLVLLDNPIKFIYFVIIILVLQQFDGNILGPKILGSSTGLSSFWVLFAILLFGGLFGFVGMLIGVPLFAVIYSIISGLVKTALGKRQLSTDTLDYKNLSHIDPTDHSYQKLKDPIEK